MQVLRSDRLLGYPRLLLGCFSLVLLVNVLFRDGWMGGLGQLIGVDFVCLYAAGWLYRFDTVHLYDLARQWELQAQLVQMDLGGMTPLISPPWVALAYAALTPIPLVWAFILWTLSMLLCVVIATRLGLRLLAPGWLIAAGLTPLATLVIVTSSLPFIEGLQVGQSHALTLLLTTGMAVCTLTGRWWLAGTLAGCMLYKPQFLIGFLILWCVWRRYAALLAFTGVASVWAGAVVAGKGLAPYLAYLSFSEQLLRLPYADGFPAFLLVTPFGLLTTLLPGSSFPVLAVLVQLLFPALALGLAVFAYRQRRASFGDRRESVALALVFPLLASPHALLHDLLVLLPAFLLLAHDRARAPMLLRSAVATYCGATLLPMLGSGPRIALVALVPIAFLLLNARSFAGQERRVSVPEAPLAAPSP
jgi:alpha-1,2-mannosyltransferase